MKPTEGKTTTPKLDQVLAIVAGLSFYVLCMILPLVGPSGAKVEYALKNKATFLAVLMTTFILAAASTYFRLERRKVEQRALPWFSIGLCTVCLLMLVVLLFNGFAI